MESGPSRVGRFAILLLALYVIGLSFSVSTESARDSPKTGDELVTVEVAKSRSKRALRNFGSMIACVIPDVSNAITAALRYTNCGCCCGTGGSGNPVDEIDHGWVWQSCGQNRPLSIAVARMTGAMIAL